MEVQQRPAWTYNNEPQSSGAFQYIAISIDAASITLKEWIAILVCEAANASGVVSKVGERCSGTFKPFIHLGEKRGGIRKSILNGLDQFGLTPGK